jgi:hypothetical protein
MTDEEADRLLDRLARSHGLSFAEFIMWLPEEYKEALLQRLEYHLTK